MKPHAPQRDPDTPGVCWCGLPLGTRNARHIGWPDTDPAVTEAEAQRLGEPREED